MIALIFINETQNALHLFHGFRKRAWTMRNSNNPIRVGVPLHRSKFHGNTVAKQQTSNHLRLFYNSVFRPKCLTHINTQGSHKELEPVQAYC